MMFASHHERASPAGLLFRPCRTVGVLARCGACMTPLTLAVGLALATAASLLPDMMLTIAATGAGSPPVMLVWLAAAATLVLAFAITWAVHGVLLAGVSRWGAAPITPAVALRLAPWLWLPLGLRLAIYRAADLLGIDRMHLGVSGLIEQFGQPAPLMQQVLWQCDLFFAWHLILVGVALTYLARLSAARLVDALLVYGLLALVFQAVLTLGAAA